MLTYVHQFLFSWVFTLFVETLVFIALVRQYFKIPKTDISLMRLITGGVFASTITIPFVWFIFPVLIYNSIVVAVVVGEVFAFVVEAIFYVFAFKFSVRQAVLISLFANAASFLLGQIVFMHR
jgi:hypothetical protein